MATSLLRLGRLGTTKVIQRESWGLLKSPSAAAALCTKAEPKKAVKKAKSASKTLKASEERAALLAYKTTVAFPIKPLASGLSSAQALGQIDHVASPVTAGTIVTGPAEEPTCVSTINAAVAVENKSPAPNVADPVVNVSTADRPVASEATQVEAASPEAPLGAEPTNITAPIIDSAPLVINVANVVEEAASPVAEPGIAVRAEDPAPEDIPVTAFAVPSDVGSPSHTEAGGPSADSSSSSSSDSDSDIDSDSDSEMPEANLKANPDVLMQEAKPDILVQEAKPDILVQVANPDIQVQEATENGTLVLSSKAERVGLSEAIPVATAEALQDTTPAASLDAVSKTRLKEDAPDVLGKVVQVATPGIERAQLVDHAPVQEPGPAEATLCARSEGLLEAAIEASPKVVSLPHVENDLGAQVAAGKMAAEAVAEATPIEGAAMETLFEAAPVEVAAEELVDTAPVMAEAAGEELIAQPAAEAEPPSEEAHSEPTPEPFDNTTYKNLQHHNYNPYTFADLDLEMARYRLPQPTTGRPSPRH